MKRILLIIAFLLSLNSWAIKLKDYKPFKFEVLFTNPVCATHFYKNPIITESGTILQAPPQNVYCKPSDEQASVARPNSPQYRLREWILDSETEELYLAYLSFNSKNVAQALCQAIERGVKVSIVLDGGEDATNPKLNKEAEELKKCGKEGLVSVVYRGSSSGLGFAHNKIMVVNPGSKTVKVVFSSGNMTTGTSINHENWNFVTTSGMSYFAAAHKCVIESMISSGDSKKNFAASLNTCRGLISSSPEDDIQLFFSPVDGAKAFEKVAEAGNRSQLIEGMSHRFSGKMADLYKHFLNQGKLIKFILDDDIYWSAKRRLNIGRNTRFEAFKLYNELISAGMETKFMQTNQNVFQLQHNKFMIFTFENNGAVFNGAGNFTTSAFTKNFENFYYITIPEVVEAYNKQFDLYFNQMSSRAEDMPRDYILP
jgi:HKD family nuclease